jgi:hypothetical protein
MVVALVAALAWYVAFQSSYLVYNIDQVVPIVAATLLAAALAGSESLGRLAGRVVTARSTTAALAALVVALAVYGLFVRPVMQPFAAFHNGTGLDGTRDFREESLRNLAVYVGWPLLVIALGGAAITIARFARPAAPAAERALLITGFMYCLLYAWAPLVSPDHPWAIRRFVPVVMPMVVVLAAMALRYIGRRPGRRSVVAGFLMAGAAVEVAATSGVPMATMRENQGAAALMGAVDAALQEALVASDLPAANVAAVLSVARGRPIVVADFRQRITRTAVARWLEAKTREGKSAWLLSGERIPPTGVRMGVVDQWQFERRALARTTRPPARDAENESVR